MSAEKVPRLEDLAVAPAEVCEAAGLQAAAWLAALVPGPHGTLLLPDGRVVPPERVARAVRYRDVALGRWLESLPAGESGQSGYVAPDPALVSDVEVGPPSERERRIAAAVAIAERNEAA